jgi:RNA polymerase sigma-70 factor (ECF subfamily)
MTGVLEVAAQQREFERIISAHGPAISRLARAFTRSESDREDLFQEIAIALWQALPRFRGECSERTFLFRIANNKAIDWLARRRSERSLPDFEVPDCSPGAEAGLLRRERSDRLRKAVRRLPVILRQIVILALEDLSYREIAEVLGISESNAGARLTRARQLLREALEQNQ